MTGVDSREKFESKNDKGREHFESTKCYKA